MAVETLAKERQVMEELYLEEKAKKEQKLIALLEEERVWLESGQFTERKNDIKDTLEKELKEERDKLEKQHNASSEVISTMCNIKWKLMKELKSRGCGQILKGKKLRSPSLIDVSAEGTHEQDLHRDGGVGCGNYSLICGLLGGGHLYIMDKTNPFLKRDVKFKKGDLLVFSSDMMHAGGDYKAQNRRLHMYLTDGGEEGNHIFLPDQMVQIVDKNASYLKRKPLFMDRVKERLKQRAHQ